jgi:hypothetical protein
VRIVPDVCARANAARPVRADLFFRAKMHFLHLCLDHLDTHAFLDPKRSIRRGESEICRSSRSDRQNTVRASANNISPPKFFGLVGQIAISARSSSQGKSRIARFQSRK